jgi:hypothetical protein
VDGHKTYFGDSNKQISRLYFLLGGWTNLNINDQIATSKDWLKKLPVNTVRKIVR